jgi:hypothetical protein
MSGPEYDPDFEAWLRGRARLDRRLPRSMTRLEPPAELDRIVIGMAREAIHPLPNAPLFRAPKWAVPLAMAASLLVSFTLMLDVGLRQGMPQEAVSEPVVVEMTNPTAPPAQAPAAALAVPAAPTTRESPRVSTFHMFRQRLAANRLSSSHHGAVASTPAPAVAAADAEGARAAEPAAAGVEEARYGGGHAPAPFRLASAPPEMDTVVVIGTRIPGGPFGTR